MNTLASVFIGRKYLSLSAELVPTLINALILEDDPVSRPHLLGNFRMTLGNVQFRFYIYISLFLAASIIQSIRSASKTVASTRSVITDGS